MFLIYLDESGKPYKNDKSENFTIAGVIINEDSWNDIDEKITNLKKSLFKDKWELFEFHMSEILHGNKIYSIIVIWDKNIVILMKT